MELISLSLIAVILVVAVFDFTNGFHDAADMVATAIASRAMKPGVAIAIVSGFTFIAPFTVGLAVADTVGTFVDITSSSPLTGEGVVIGALLAAISFNLVTWKLGYPSSSSNSLAGGLVGAGLYAVGAGQIQWGIDALQSAEFAHEWLTVSRCDRAKRGFANVAEDKRARKGIHSHKLHTGAGCCRVCFLYQPKIAFFIPSDTPTILVRTAQAPVA